MSTSLSSLVDNLSKGFNSHKYIDCKSYLRYMSIKDDRQGCTQLIFRCFKCKKKYKKDLIKNYSIGLQAHMNFVIKILINLFYY